MNFALSCGLQICLRGLGPSAAADRWGFYPRSIIHQKNAYSLFLLLIHFAKVACDLASMRGRNQQRFECLGANEYALDVLHIILDNQVLCVTHVMHA